MKNRITGILICLLLILSILAVGIISISLFTPEIKETTSIQKIQVSIEDEDENDDENLSHADDYEIFFE